MHLQTATQQVEDSLLSSRTQLSANRSLVRFNDALAKSPCFNGQDVSREKLVPHLLVQIASILQASVVEYWEYDWTTMTATPTTIINNGAFANVAAVHPMPKGLPLPKALIEANRRPRRRSGVYLSTFAQQSDVNPKLFDYYRSIADSEQFLHFPFSKGDDVASGIVAIVDRKIDVGGNTVEFAQALVNRLMKILEVIETSTDQFLTPSSSQPVQQSQSVRPTLSTDPTEKAVDIAAAKAIFLDALEQPLRDRSPYVQQACGNDQALINGVKRLLLSHQERDGSVLDLDFGKLLVDEVTSHQPDALNQDASGTSVFTGKYKLREQLGCGGSSVVFRGLQMTPFKRSVAVKVMRNSSKVKNAKHECLLAQFNAERETLGMMNHPNIVTVIEAGSIAGQPFLVMELVDGVSVTDYCDQQSLSLHATLNLFVQVCRAVQHVHQQRIVHRDLKPTNVLVTVVDGEPLVKLIDFGLAKPFHDTLALKACEHKKMVGTLAYMSPEQLKPGCSSIDGRSDIFSLGILLYRLLTGQIPFARSKESSKGTFAQFLEGRQADTPMIPSVRAMNNPDPSSTSEHNRSDSQELVGALRSGMDEIVMKCLQKDPSQRFATTGLLIAAIERYTSQSPSLE